jgi:membrane associated rhomboid family serine protease
MAFFENGGHSREPFLVAPASVLWLIGVILAAHGFRVLLPGDWPELTISAFAFIPARYALARDFTADNSAILAIPFISHIFLHAGWGHAAVNSLWLLAFGPMAARRLGTLKFLVFFLYCGIAGALAHLAIYWGSFDAVVGASGAVSGLMGATMRMVYGRNDVLGLAPLFSRSMLAFSLMWAVANAITGFVGFGAGEQVTLVAWAVHLGGYLAGILSISLFRGTGDGEGHKHSRGGLP